MGPYNLIAPKMGEGRGAEYHTFIYRSTKLQAFNAVTFSHKSTVTSHILFTYTILLVLSIYL